MYNPEQDLTPELIKNILLNRLDEFRLKESGHHHTITITVPSNGIYLIKSIDKLKLNPTKHKYDFLEVTHSWGTISEPILGIFNLNAGINEIVVNKSILAETIIAEPIDNETFLLSPRTIE